MSLDLLLSQEMAAHAGVIWTLAFSRHGRYLASGGADGVVRVWRVLPHRGEQVVRVVLSVTPAQPFAAPLNYSRMWPETRSSALQSCLTPLRSPTLDDLQPPSCGR